MGGSIREGGRQTKPSTTETSRISAKVERGKLYGLVFIDPFITAFIRIVGELMDWDGSSGFLQLDSLENSPKISLHITNIRSLVYIYKILIQHLLYF